MTKPKPHPQRLLTAITLAVAVLATACGSDSVAFGDVAQGQATLIKEADVEFVEISPFATFGSAQGNFGEGAHGTFGIFGAGQSSPPHTHSGAYNAVVLEGGTMNNPFGSEAESPELAAGSFWSVPADSEHVTACLDPNQECRFFFHASAGFDFFPLDALVEDRADGARSTPLNSMDFTALDPYDGAVPVWGDSAAGSHGTIIKIAAGQSTGELAHRSAFTAVPTVGNISVEIDETELSMVVGSIVEFTANTPHSMTCDSDADCVFYIFAEDALNVQS